MGQACIGLYWTLPVNWTGFRTLATTVDAAAMASRTIRYQRACVRRYVAESKGNLVHEVAFMDTRPDRATDAVSDVLLREAARFANSGAAVVVVAFEEVHLWRRNPYLADTAAQMGLELIPLPPDPILIDGQWFNPIQHFEQWRERDRIGTTRLHLEAIGGVLTALADTPDGPGRWTAIAARLNSDGIRTKTGRPWTAENVRKLTSRLQKQ